MENEQIKQARLKQKSFSPETFANGDTRKQLLARSRYLLYKAPSNWTENQYQRSKILFEQYPDIKLAFKLMQRLRDIFNKIKRSGLYKTSPLVQRRRRNRIQSI